VGANGEVFEAARAFGGTRDGFVFKMGAHGLGYYTDKPLHLRDQVQADADEQVKTKLAPDPAPRAAPPPPAAEEGGSSKPLPKLPFSNSLLYDLD
jgi:hypothetical protein